MAGLQQNNKTDSAPGRFLRFYSVNKTACPDSLAGLAVVESWNMILNLSVLSEWLSGVLVARSTTPTDM